MSNAIGSGSARSRSWVTKVTGYLEKPEKEFLICSGIAVFEPRVVDLVAGLSLPAGLGDAVNASVRAGYRVAHWQHGSLWFDVNDPREMERASEALRERAAAVP